VYSDASLKYAVFWGHGEMSRSVEGLTDIAGLDTDGRLAGVDIAGLDNGGPDIDGRI